MTMVIVIAVAVMAIDMLVLVAFASRLMRRDGRTHCACLVYDVGILGRFVVRHIHGELRHHGVQNYS